MQGTPDRQMFYPENSVAGSGVSITNTSDAKYGQRSDGFSITSNMNLGGMQSNQTTGQMLKNMNNNGLNSGKTSDTF